MGKFTPDGNRPAAAYRQADAGTKLRVRGHAFRAWGPKSNGRDDNYKRIIRDANIKVQ